MRLVLPVMTDRLMGIDLAWSPHRNASGIAVGSIHGNSLAVESVHSAVYDLRALFDQIHEVDGLRGVAIDAPLIINNPSGRRPCENQLAAVYSRKWAGPHTSNLGLYPDAASVRLSNALLDQGFAHLGGGVTSKWQVECYPHPAIVEIFGLEKRLAYKKGSVEQRRGGQARLARLLKSLRDDTRLSLELSELGIVDEAFIRSLTGKALKQNEDALDAIVCLYIAGLYEVDADMQVFGDTDSGYIVVPSPNGRRVSH